MTKPTVIPVPTEDTEQLNIPLNFINADETQNTIGAQASQVQRVVWVGPTAGNVQSAFTDWAPALEAQGYKCLCFTARLTPLHRQRLEAEIHSLLGPNAPNHSQLILFASSAFGEGNDWDCDSLILQPHTMPNIIQPVGRLWRFNRQRPVGAKPRLFITRPTLETKNGKPSAISLGGLDKVIGRAQQDLGWRKWYALNTYFLLLQKGSLQLPFDSQALIDRAFNLSSGYPALMPENWRPLWDALLRHQKTVAATERLTISGSTIPANFNEDEVNPERELMEKFTAVKPKKIKHLTRLIKGALSFYVSPSETDPNLIRNPSLLEIQRRTVSVSNRGYLANAVLELVPQEWKQHKILNSMPRLIEGMPVVLNYEGQNGRMAQVIVKYTSEVGLQFLT